jgi:hypothetical protein
MWQEFLGNATRDNVWKALEFTKPAMDTALPILTDEFGNCATLIEDKRQMLMHHAFPHPPNDNSTEYIFKSVRHYHTKVTSKIIGSSIWGQASKKSPGPDGIGPAALKMLFLRE